MASMTGFVRTAPFPVFLFMFGIFVAMAVIPVWVALRTRKRAQLIAATPTSNVGFATDGYVELEGRAEAVDRQTITTPLTGTACVWYRAMLERYERRRTDDSPTWHTVRDVTSADPFVLRDGTGACLVFPDGAEVTCTDRSVWFGSTPVPENKNPDKKGPGESPEGMVTVYGMSGQEYRYTEERIYDGDPLYALGQFWSQPWAEDEEDVVDEEADDDEMLSTEKEAESDEEASGPGHGGAWDPFDREEDLMRRAAAITHRRLMQPKAQPFLLSTTPQAKLLEVHGTGWKGALFVSIVPAAIAGFLAWLRFAPA